MKINKSRGQLAGQGQAIAGLVLGGFGMLIMPILAAMVIPAFSVARGRAQEAQCMNNVKQISVAWEMFELETGKPPRSIADLEKTRPGITALKCPLARDGEASYETVAAESASASDPNSVVRIRETEPRHRGRHATAFADGRVEMTSEP